ncbi:MAG: ABC transporter ATP-binding protein [Candidatus Cloacimonadaceae bacterium]|jgi:lipoprotein-releasing system ATP-binding protein|nr:ABC transporter ATP-binding protein [Candidatus Cloacimonadota bacterium]MDY0127294.1 ABC transporter ATP-binding protein [Candidatus Cloacimonadaceae bacterium]MCB5254963.1 ABC transporter ATP-binding protein [Candidatus Cloacimonadota bacterium]MCK9178177.1 ABC transporter ATP-binding protein [Candidatus Cloacimonadota bacterium]MCK9242983.1 ABC transporter ATP-binding protein [Candidatus Cloacimonadota bacterium]
MILSAKDLKKTYIDSDQRIEVLTGACLDVAAGDLICITGKSGSGKSTMLHIMGLLDAPDSGELIMEGKKIEAKSPKAPTIRNRDLGFVFQFHYLVEDLTATENVALPLLIAGQSEAKAMARAKELLCILGLSERLKRYPNQLSGGEQQRVSLARALANRPKLVLADEPTGNLDPVHSKEVWDMILSLNKGEFRQTFVIVTHDVEAAQAADRVFELVNGILIPA